MKEASYKKNHMLWVILFIWNVQKGKSIEAKSGLAVAGAGGSVDLKENGELLLMGFPFGALKVF